jgi:hypothetical protein
VRTLGRFASFSSVFEEYWKYDEAHERNPASSPFVSDIKNGVVVFIAMDC